MWGDPGGWVDNNCSPTRSYEPDMAEFRPEGTRVVTQSADENAGVQTVAERPDDNAGVRVVVEPAEDDAPALLLVGLALLAAAAGTVAVVRRRRWADRTVNPWRRRPRTPTTGASPSSDAEERGRLHSGAHADGP